MIKTLINQKITPLVAQVKKPSKLTFKLGQISLANKIGKYALIALPFSLVIPPFFEHKLILSYFFAILLASNVLLKLSDWFRKKLDAYQNKINEINTTWLDTYRNDKDVQNLIQRLSLMFELYWTNKYIGEKTFFNYQDIFEIKEEIESLEHNQYIIQKNWSKNFLKQINDELIDEDDKKIEQLFYQYESVSLEKITHELIIRKKIYYDLHLTHYSNEINELTNQNKKKLFLANKQHLAL